MTNLQRSEKKEYIYFTDPIHLALNEAILHNRKEAESRIIPLPYSTGKVPKVKTPRPSKIVKPKKERRVFDPSFTSKYISYLKRAEEKKIPFNLSVDEFNKLIEANCTYCGIEFCGGVDRIDSKKGYEDGNNTPCCSKCNMMKYTMPVGAFRSHIDRIYKHLFG